MRTIKCKKLNPVDCLGLISFHDMINCSGYKIGESPIEFFRDLLCCNIGDSGYTAFSIVKCKKREMIIDEIEQHICTAEVLIPLDGDVVIFAGPATDGIIPPEFKAFIVPQYTMVIFDFGVWHKAPFPIKNEIVNSIVVLPPLTYSRDCNVLSLEQEQKCRIIV